MKIAISGKSGCGNTSTSTVVAERLGFRMINYTFRSMAEESGLSFAEFCALAEKDDSYDIALDKKQVELASEGDCVLGSRLAVWMLKDADLKVFLYASDEVRAKRIRKREQRDLQEVIEETKTRDARDTARYKRIYGIDNDDFAFVDLLIDTDGLDQYQVADLIVKKAVELGAESVQS